MPNEDDQVSEETFDRREVNEDVCDRCRLSATRTHVVVGRGDPHAKIVFLAEAPGREEDLRGEGFRGTAGKEFDAILAFLGISRDEIWLANAVRCRPSVDGRRNRPPRPDEILACHHWLEQDLVRVLPRVIVTLGRIAFETVSAKPWTPNYHGRKIDAPQWNATLFALYHPAYLIYRRNFREQYYRDLVELRHTLNLHQIALGEAKGPWTELYRGDNERRENHHEGRN